jgi:hypothetical protein
MAGVQSLLRSRKFLLACLGVVNTLASHYLDIPKDVWLSIDALLLAVIAGIAVEDAAEKGATAAAVRERLGHYAGPEPRA